MSKPPVDVQELEDAVMLIYHNRSVPIGSMVDVLFQNIIERMEYLKTLDIRPSRIRRLILSYNWENKLCILIESETLRPTLSDEVYFMDSAPVSVTSGNSPHKEASTGRITIDDGPQYYPSVLKMRWVLFETIDLSEKSLPQYLRTQDETDQTQENDPPDESH